MADHTIHLNDRAFELLNILKHNGQSANGFIIETLERLARQNHKSLGGNDGKPEQKNNQHTS